MPLLHLPSLASSRLGALRHFAVLVALAIVATLAPLALRMPAAAADDALSHLNMGCTIDNTSDYQQSDHTGGSLSHETPSNAVAADAARQSIHVFSNAGFAGDTAVGSGEDCGADGSFRYHLAVGAGTSGLSPGDLVRLTATVHLDGYLDESFDVTDEDFTTNANLRARYSLSHPASNGDCGMEVCPEATGSVAGGVQLEAFSERTVQADGPDGSLETYADRYWYRLSSNVDDGIDASSDTAGVLCGSWPAGCAGDPTPFRFPQGATTIELETTVGSVLDASGGLDAFTQAYTSNVSAIVDFTLNVEITPAPGYEGLDVDLVAAAEPEPEPEPTVVTPPLGGPPVPGLGYPAESLCAAGSVLVGIRGETRVVAESTTVASVRAVCADPAAPDPAPMNEGDQMGDSATGATGETLCLPGQVVVGMEGRQGDFVDQVAVRCQPEDLTGDGSSAPPFGGDGGAPVVPIDCPDGGPAIGVSGEVIDWNPDHVRSISLVCTPTDPGDPGDPDGPVAPGAPTLSLPAVVNLANQHAVVVSGTGDPATTATIRADDTDAATAPIVAVAPVGASGFSATLDVSSLTDGVLTVTAELTDDRDTTGPTTTTTVAKDTVAPGAPTATLTNPINRSNVASVVVAGAGEAGTTAVIWLDDTSAGIAPVFASVGIGASGYSATLDASDLANGPITATVAAEDPAGNRSQVATATATKSVTPVWLRLVRRALTGLFPILGFLPMARMIRSLLTPLLAALANGAAEVQALVCSFVGAVSQTMAGVLRNGSWWERIAAGVVMVVMRTVRGLARC